MQKPQKSKHMNNWCDLIQVWNTCTGDSSSTAIWSRPTSCWTNTDTSASPIWDWPAISPRKNLTLACKLDTLLVLSLCCWWSPPPFIQSTSKARPNRPADWASKKRKESSFAWLLFTRERERVEHGGLCQEPTCFELLGCTTLASKESRAKSLPTRYISNSRMWKKPALVVRTTVWKPLLFLSCYGYRPDCGTRRRKNRPQSLGTLPDPA